MELFPTFVYIGDVGKGFPDDVGNVGGDLEVGDFLMEGVPGEECGGPVRVFFVQRAVVFLGLAELPFELCGRGLEAFD